MQAALRSAVHRGRRLGFRFLADPGWEARVAGAGLDSESESPLPYVPEGVCRQLLPTYRWADLAAETESKSGGNGKGKGGGGARSKDSARLQLLLDVARTGAAVVEGCGTERDFVRGVGGLLGYGLQSTIYGDTFDVKEEVKPINAAYSSVSLEPHVDLCYYESPPGLQLLLCRRFDSQVWGGESALLDFVLVAESLRTMDPAAFLALAACPLAFQKVHYDRELPVHMTYQRPAIALAGSAGLPPELARLAWEALRLRAVDAGEAPGNT